MPMRCSNCGETKPEEKFFLPAFNRFAAYCEECRKLAGCGSAAKFEHIEKRIEARPREPVRNFVRPEGASGRKDELRLFTNPAVASDLAFVIGQLQVTPHGR